MKSLTIIIFILYTFFISSSYSEVRRVPQQYNTIQLAIDNSNIGDTILIDIGNYIEKILINKSISLIGTNINGISITPPFESFPTLTCNTLSIENTSNVLIKNVKVNGRYVGYFREGGNGIALLNCQFIILDSIEVYGGKGSDALCSFQYSSPARDGGHSVYSDHSSNININSSVLIGGAGGATNIYDPHCDPYIAKKGYSIWAANNSDITIYDAKSVITILQDSTSTINNLTVIENNLNIEQEKDFILEQNYPNPFNPITIIKYSISKYSFVTLEVFDILGNKINTLVSGLINSGSYFIEFNANDLSSGVYLYCLKSNNSILTKKFILLK